MAKPVLLDNTVLSNLALVGRCDLVCRLWGSRVVSTSAVLSEYEAGAGVGLVPPRCWADLPLVELTAAEAATSETLSRRLGEGERTCLAVCRSRGGLFASDDSDAREVAARLNVPVTGTVGILTLSVRRSLLTLTQANVLLADMVAGGYRAPVRRLDDLV